VGARSASFGGSSTWLVSLCVQFVSLTHTPATPTKALKEEGRTREAERTLTRLITEPRQQGGLVAYRLLAQMRQGQGRHADAIRLCDKALALGSDDLVGWVGLEGVGGGGVGLKNGRLGLARQLVELLTPLPCHPPSNPRPMPSICSPP